MKKQSRGSKRKIILGITGSFGSGKSTVAAILGSFGAKVIDADKIAHSIIRPGTKTYKKIVNAFGRDILKGNKAISRERLAKIVFSSKRLLRRLNGIVHPEVIRVIRQRIKSSSASTIVLDAPLLIEAGLAKIADKLIVVTITRKKQIERISGKTGLRKQDILKRIKAQIPLRNKIRLADFVIDNTGTINKTKKQAEQIRRLLWKN
jgi:dephospho-CoA kinase